GGTISSNFPPPPVAYETAKAGREDAYVTIVRGVGTRIYSTLLGGGDLDSGRGITEDALGNAYITGVTASGSIGACGNVQNPPVFPTTPGAFQPNIAPSQSFTCQFGCCSVFHNTNTQYIQTVMDSFV